MEVSFVFHASAALADGKESPALLYKGWVGHRASMVAMSLENSLTPAKNPIPIHQPLSLQASHYTD
jgi:hypothetical protein